VRFVTCPAERLTRSLLPRSIVLVACSDIAEGVTHAAWAEAMDRPVKLARSSPRWPPWSHVLVEHSGRRRSHLHKSVLPSYPPTITLTRRG
jgi:hypothetical protein